MYDFITPMLWLILLVQIKKYAIHSYVEMGLVQIVSGT